MCLKEFNPKHVDFLDYLYEEDLFDFGIRYFLLRNKDHDLCLKPTEPFATNTIANKEHWNIYQLYQDFTKASQC